jgi:preprotein translocase subunit SecG
MQDSENYDIRFLPNIDICNILNNSTLGVLIGIFTGFGIEIIMNKPTVWWLSLFFFIAVAFLIIAIYMNEKYINFIKNGMINNPERIKETQEKNRKIVNEKIKECPKIVRCFRWSIILSGLLIILGITLFVLNNSTVGNTSPAPTQIICPYNTGIADCKILESHITLN